MPRKNCTDRIKQGTQSSYRWMLLDDVRQVYAIDKAIYPFPWTEGIFADCVRAGHLCVVNEINGQVISYGIVGMMVDEAHILNLSVAAQYQGQGLGRELLNYLLELVRRAGAVRALLEVRVSNQIARQLYHSFGFEEIGLRKGYYPDHEGREDAIVLAKAILSQSS